MKPITKKRLKAISIDVAISTVVTLGLEQLLRKKVKNEFVHMCITPTLVMWGVEYGQLKRSGQTYGYKKMGLMLETQDGSELTSKQIVKRMAYRDTLSTIDYVRDREGFEGDKGTIFPHDSLSQTVVKEI